MEAFDNRMAPHWDCGTPSRVAEQLLGAFGAGRSRGGRQVPGGCLLRYALQRDDREMPASLEAVHDEFQADAWLAPDLRLRSGAGRVAGPAGAGLESWPAGGHPNERE